MRLGVLSVFCIAGAFCPGFAVAQEGPIALGFTAGVAAFMLPGTETGIYPQEDTDGTFGPVVDPLGLGLHLGVNGAVALGDMGGHHASLGFNSFVSFGRSSGTSVDTFDGPGVVVIPGYTTPEGTITLTTDGAALAPVSTSGVTAGGQTAVLTGTTDGGVTNSWGVAVAGDESTFVYGAGTTDADNDTAAAYGAIGATDGGIFIGAGDLTGLEITTSVTNSILYGGTDITLALGGVNNGWVLQGYAGPSYRFLGQRLATEIAVDIPEVPEALGLVFPDFSIDRAEDLMSHYLGGVVGLSASTQVSDTALLSLGIEGGGYYTIDGLSGTESYTVANGALTAVDPVTVVNENTASDSANGFAFAARGNAALTLPLAENRQISFGGQAEYLSRVATISRGDGTGLLASNTYDPGTSDAGTLTYDSPTANQPILSFGDMWKFTGTVSFTGQF